MSLNKTNLSNAETLAKSRPAVPVDRTRYALHPRRGWVLVKKLTPDDVIMEGGVLVDKTTARSLRAEVIEAADRADGSPSDLSSGDVVLITAFGLEMEDLEEMTGEKGLLLLRDEEVYTRCVPVE